MISSPTRLRCLRVPGYAAIGQSGGEVALYEPAHGSAPDIAGQNKANPLATILSAALLLRYSLHHEAAAKDVEAAVVAVLNEGLRTPDIMEAGCTPVGTTEMGEAVRRRI